MWQESTHLPYSFMTALWMCRSLWMRTGSIRSLVNLNETVTTMYPLVEPALEEVSDQIIKNTVGGKYILSGRQSVYNGYAFKCGGECA